MKTFKSADALKTAALQRGASASVGGVKFNSTADKVNAVFPVPLPEPEQPKPQPIIETVLIQEPPKQQDLAPIVQTAVDAMAASVKAVSIDNAKVMEEVAKVMEKISLQPQQTPQAPLETPAKHWRLKVNRNSRTGLMETCDIERIG